MVQGIGDALAKQMAWFCLFMFVGGGAVALGLYFLVTWLWAHVSVSWS